MGEAPPNSDDLPLKGGLSTAMWCMGLKQVLTRNATLGNCLQPRIFLKKKQPKLGSNFVGYIWVIHHHGWITWVIKTCIAASQQWPWRFGNSRVFPSAHIHGCSPGHGVPRWFSSSNMPGKSHRFPMSFPWRANHNSTVRFQLPRFDRRIDKNMTHFIPTQYHLNI